jgi:chromosomal replication initiator protein
MNVTQLWQNYLLVLSKEMPEQQIKTWLMPLIPAEEAGIFILYAPNNFVLRFVKERYLSRIQAL